MPDRIASSILAAFTALPARSKPRVRPDGGGREWVTLAGIALENGDGDVTCTSIGTGVKCLPSSKIPLAKGLVLHDCHAEILAIRAYNAFLISECQRILSPETYTSPFLRLRSLSEITHSTPQPFAMRPDIRIHMFTSEAPCGDSSMELTMSTQDDPTPWSSPAISSSINGTTTTTTTSTLPLLLRGRGYFSHLGTIRTKPGRSDSPPTHSKSCSDKLSTKTYLSLLLTPTSYLIVPQSPQTYISTLTLPESEYTPTGCFRAFGKGGRLSPISSNPKSIGGYSFHAFEVQTTSLNFPFSRRLHMHDPPGTPEPTPSNISTVSIPPHKTHETIISGVLQGRKAFSGNVLGASVVSKMRLWKGVASVAGGLLASISSIAPEESNKGNEIGSSEVHEGKGKKPEENGIEIIQDLMSWILSRKKYSELKEPEAEETGSTTIEVDNTRGKETRAGINEIAISTSTSPHLGPGPGPTIRLNRTLAKEHIRSILTSAGTTSSWVRNGGDDFELPSSESGIILESKSRREKK